MQIVWMSYNEAESLNILDLGGIGGMGKSMSLYQYIDQYYEKYQPYVKVLAKEIKDNNYIFGGDSHQEHPFGTPVLFIDDKPMFKFLMSYRAWGDFMHCIHINKENEFVGYMQFYMDSRIPDKFEIKYPGGTK